MQTQHGITIDGRGWTRFGDRATNAYWTSDDHAGDVERFKAAQHAQAVAELKARMK